MDNHSVIYHLEAPIAPVVKWRKALSTTYAAFAGWMKERRALPLKLMQSGSCPGLMLSGAELLMDVGKHICLGSDLRSVEHFGGCGAQDAFTHLSIQST